MERYVCVTEQLDGNQMMGCKIMHSVEFFLYQCVQFAKCSSTNICEKKLCIGCLQQKIHYGRIIIEKTVCICKGVLQSCVYNNILILCNNSW